MALVKDEQLGISYHENDRGWPRGFYELRTDENYECSYCTDIAGWAHSRPSKLSRTGHKEVYLCEPHAEKVLKQWEVAKLWMSV